ncbi:MAG TPA: bifunctional UDP-N-acetylglucosamine diphosphorylase/glucosamine-1-phosphate N-acetyltransferase GlmU [Bryobacteraceae bacterium]|jgi:bifunctional UDP-N-acetylglucosamine pyrophosphorylase/glucosamine-1-phosphate N-acetyltransferase
MNNDVSVVILAAGLGTRMKSRQAKVLHRAGGDTLIGHAVSAALASAPADRIFVVVGHQAEQVQQAVSTRGVGFIHQTEQKGTGHAVLCGREQLQSQGGLLLILYGDCPLVRAETIAGLIKHQTESTAAATLISTLLDDPTGYGRVIRDAQGNVQAIVEQKAANPEQLEVKEINAGIYCFRSDLFWKHAGEIQPNNPAKEYYLTDMVEILIRAGHSIQPHFIADSGELLGINTRVELAAVDRIFRDRTVQRLMLAGVTIERPETVTIDNSVQIGMDTVVEPFAQILGDTVVGENCRIGASCIVSNCQVADEVEILPFSHIVDSTLARGAHAGPYARLRMQSHVEPGAVVGNFVELKKTRLGAKTKAQHLAYLGDSTIGAGVNIGAGTITCNYDGKKKSPTKIGDGAFVGSNSTLVAPVEIGAGAYVGAGSVITAAVPEDALALGRARQVIKPDWARKRRS